MLSNLASLAEHVLEFRKFHNAQPNLDVISLSLLHSPMLAPIHQLTEIVNVTLIIQHACTVTLPSLNTSNQPLFTSPRPRTFAQFASRHLSDSMASAFSRVPESLAARVPPR